ncbi:hypothetical protein C9374_004246 [Naegleria lovaniensis]|uniref:F-box domain-containing protein n=1 Tax=Naegleria lovaniensis TaxID=51637 RepID=A0AA88GNC5_NAELO|nr:uncharacterized protein C9374_004246 [Naegleria lovaniensis]KAG2383575.1 hypothetical protein C9374_004246 [Naegleria lovaniensis]
MIILTKSCFYIYDVRNRKNVDSVLTDLTEISSCVSWHPLLDTVMIGTTSGKVMFYSTEKSKNSVTQYVPHTQELTSHAVNSITIPYKNVWPDGSIITTAANGVSSVWNYKTCRKIYDISTNEPLGNSCGALNEDHSIFAFAVTDRLVNPAAINVSLDSSLVFYPVSKYLSEIDNESEEDVLVKPFLDSISSEQPLKTNTLKFVEKVFSSMDYHKKPRQPSYLSYLRLKKAAKHNHSEKMYFSNFHDLPSELIGNILEYLQATSLPLLSVVSKQFRECIFERLNTLIIDSPMHDKFYTSFLPEFMNVQHLIFKGVAVQDVSLLISQVRNKVEKLTLILPTTDVLAPGINIENLLVWNNLSELVIYHSRRLLVRNKTVPLEN